MLSPSTLSHETARSPPRATHQFWVSASTRLGEGEATRVVTVLPSDSGIEHIYRYLGNLAGDKYTKGLKKNHFFNFVSLFI